MDENWGYPYDLSDTPKQKHIVGSLTTMANLLVQMVISHEKNGVPYFETDSIWIYACVSMYVHPHVHMCGIFIDLSCAHGIRLPISFSC